MPVMGHHRTAPLPGLPHPVNPAWTDQPDPADPPQPPKNIVRYQQLFEVLACIAVVLGCYELLVGAMWLAIACGWHA